MPSSTPITIFWFRRDLRLHDNAGFFNALKNHKKVLPLFIFDRDILDELEDRKDRRVEFIHQVITNLKESLQKNNSDIIVKYGKPLDILKEIAQRLPIEAVYTNHDYEPYAKERDKSVGDFLEKEQIEFHTFKDQCIFERKEILTNQEGVYSVFTPYSRKWKAKFEEEGLPEYPTEEYFNHLIEKDNELLADFREEKIISLEEMDFEAVGKEFPSKDFPEDIVKVYDQQRNFPAKKGTTRLSIHLRFGTVSIREMARRAEKLNETWLNELIWRDFYMMILDNFPHVVNESYRREYDQIKWRNVKEEFEKWCKGKTGYPIVDAGMREMNATGFMHNRVRMVVASFLTKHLLVHWSWGEAYFAEKLLDYELSSNNGGWQWAAGSGTDAAPYFRIFNPESQTKKFDPDLKYIRKWVPEFQQIHYKPMVEHTSARERCLETYKNTLKKED